MCMKKEIYKRKNVRIILKKCSKLGQTSVTVNKALSMKFVSQLFRRLMLSSWFKWQGSGNTDLEIWLTEFVFPCFG